NRTVTNMAVINSTQQKNMHNSWQQSSIALFAQHNWSITDTFNWYLGARQYWLKSKLRSGQTDSQRISASGSVTSSRQIDQPRRNHDQTLVLSTGVTYDGWSNTLLRFSFAQGYVYPTLAHLYATTSAHSQTIYGNPN